MKWFWKCPSCGRRKEANTEHPLFAKWQKKGKADFKDFCWGKCMKNVTKVLVFEEGEEDKPATFDSLDSQAPTAEFKDTRSPEQRALDTITEGSRSFDMGA